MGIVDALRGDVHNGLSAAAAVEMIHAASLIIDDLPCMDNAWHRRGELALHRKLGEPATILAALALINLAYRSVDDDSGRAGSDDCSASTRPGMRGWADRTCRRAVGRFDLSQTPAAQTSIAMSKTGVLFEFASRSGGVLCGAEVADLRRLARFGRRFGLGYQMLDDLYDGESRRGAATGSGDERSGRLVAIRRVFETARESARGTAWQEVAGAFIRPVDEMSRAAEHIGPMTAALEAIAARP